MSMHTVRKLSRLSGVSVRTLHHYDRIGLLKPARVGSNGYRYYGEAELLRLQQILLHRELGLPLASIAAVLDTPGKDRIGQLRAHREALSRQAERYRALIATIDNTIASLEGRRTMNPRDLYAGITPEKQAQYEEELVERHGEGMRREIAESRNKLQGISQAELQQRIQELAEVEGALATLCREKAPLDDPRLAPLLARHRNWVSSMWGKPCPLERYAGLADLYATHPDFRSRYEALAPGFSDYLPDAMRSWAAQAA